MGFEESFAGVSPEVPRDSKIEESRKEHETALRTVYFQSVSPEIFREELKANTSDISDICFTRAVFGLKSVKSKIRGHIVPLGGQIDPRLVRQDGNRIERSAKVSATRVHAFPIAPYLYVGRRRIDHDKGDEEGKKRKGIVFLSNRLSPYDKLYSLYERDHYGGFHRLTLNDLKQAFQKGDVWHKGANRVLLDSLVSGDIVKEQRPDSPIEPVSFGEKEGKDFDSIRLEGLQKGYLDQFQKYEMEKKRIVLTSLIRFSRAVPEDKRDEEYSQLKNAQSYESMQEMWYRFATNYLQGEEKVRSLENALEISNFIEELEIIKRNLENGRSIEEDTEATLRLFFITPSPGRLSKAHKDILREVIGNNSFLLDILGVNGDENRLFNEINISQESLDFRNMSFKEYNQYSSDYDIFLSSMVQLIFRDLKREGVSDYIVDQYIGIKGCSPEDLVNVVLGRGSLIDKYCGNETPGKCSADRLVFEARRKMFVLHRIMKSVPEYEKVISNGSWPFSKMWESITSSPDENGKRSIDFDNNRVDFMHKSRAVKEKSSFIRKALLRGDSNTQDVFACSIVLDTQDMGLISPIKEKIFIKGKEVEITDSQLIFNLWRKIQKSISGLEPKGEWTVSLDRFETPENGGYKGKSPGSSSEMRFSKLSLCLRSPGGVQYVQEVQIYTPRIEGNTIVQGSFFLKQKEEDDFRYSKARVIELARTRSFAASFFPDDLYPHTPVAHRK